MNSTAPERLVFDAKTREERAYWLNRLGGEVGLSTIVRDDERPQAYSTEMDAAEFTLTGAPFRRLSAFTGGSPFLTYTLLMTALKICLHKYMGSDVVVVGSPALKELGRANAVAIADAVPDHATVRELLVAVRETLLEAYRRQTYPFLRLAEDLGKDPSAERCPFFDVVLVLRELHGEIPDLRNDMTIIFSQGVDELSGRLLFRRGLVNRGAAERFAGHLLRVAGQLIEGVDDRIADVGMLTDTERDE